MSKTADMKKGNSKTKQTHDTQPKVQDTQPTQEAQPKVQQPVQAKEPVAKMTPSQSEQIARQLAQLERKYCQTGKILLTHDAILSDHDKAIKQLESDVKCLKGSLEQSPVEEDSSQAKQVAETTDQPATEAKSETKEAPVKAKIGYTGRTRVFFVHDENGNIDEEHPFYRPLDAKYYDPEYIVVPAWVENGKYVRPLTRNEGSAL